MQEVELKEKLADVFSAPQGGTSTSSKSIIANLVNKFNLNAINKGAIVYESRKGVINNSPDINIIPQNERNITSSENFKKWFKKSKVVDEEGNVYFQSAYHGTPHRFDEFSTEHLALIYPKIMTQNAHTQDTK